MTDFAAQRDRLVEEMRQLMIDADHWNRAHPNEEPIVIDPDISVDVDDTRRLLAGEHPCSSCGELTLNESLCRECDIEQALARTVCKHCGQHIWNDNAIALGMKPRDHTPECPMRCSFCDSRGCLVCGPRIDALAKGGG